MRFDIQFPFVVRQGLLAAESIAAQLLSDNRRGVVLRLTASTDDSTGVTSVGTRIEGGTYILVSLFDRSTVDGGDREDWVVVGARARYWARGASGCRRYRKTEQSLSTDDLRAMEDAGGRMGPHVMDPTDINGEIGIYWDNAAQSGYIKPDPDRDQEDHYTLVDRVTYSVLVPGDRKRAVAEAEARLAAY